MNTISSIVLSTAVALLFSACGGGTSGGDTPKKESITDKIRISKVVPAISKDYYGVDSYEYDTKNRMTKHYADLPVNGNIYKFLTGYTYDEQGNLTEIQTTNITQSPDQKSISYYNYTGNVWDSRIAYSRNGILEAESNITKRDSEGFPLELKTIQYNADGTQALLSLEKETYDEDGLLVKRDANITIYRDGEALTKQSIISYTYDKEHLSEDAFMKMGNFHKASIPVDKYTSYALIKEETNTTQGNGVKENEGTIYEYTYGENKAPLTKTVKTLDGNIIMTYRYEYEDINKTSAQ